MASFTPEGVSLTGPTPVERAKKGSKLHMLSGAQGIPLTVAVSGANLHDSLALKPLIPRAFLIKPQVARLAEARG